MDYRSNKESKIRTDDTTRGGFYEQDKPIKFVDHIKKLLENTYSDDENRMKMSIGELADKVGINRGVFAKIVNGSRPKGYSASRDCIIAIGVVLRLNQEESNKTLNLYGMASLDSKLRREKKIIDELENGHDTLESFNATLVSEPNPVEPLHVIDPRGASKGVSIAQEEGPYVALRPMVKTYTQEDPYDSLETAYGFHRYNTYATMLLKERATGRAFKLTAEPSGDLCVREKPEPASEDVDKQSKMAKQEQNPKKSIEILKSIPTTTMNYKTYAYRLGSRREHLRNIAPRIASDRAQALAAELDIKLPDHHTLVRASNPRIRCAVDDPRAILPIKPPDGEEASRLLDLWDEDEIVVMLIGNMETLNSEVFEKLYGRLDVDHQIEVDESIREFANNAVGCDYWDSDD